MVVFVGYVPKHGVTMVWGNNEGVGGGGWFVWGRERKPNTHRKSKQTTKKWLADGARLDRWWGKTGGKDDQKIAECCCGLLTVHNSAWDYLTSTPLHCARVVSGMQRPHDKGKRAVGFMVSTTTGAEGRVRGLKNKFPWLY